MRISMKRLILLSALLNVWVMAIATSSASSPASGPAMKMVEGMINVDLRLNLRDIPVKSNEVVIVEPYLVNGTDSLALGMVGVYGRSRYIQFERGLTGKVPVPDYAIKSSGATPDYLFSTQIPYQEWMDGATLNLKMDRYGCANCSKGGSVYVTDIARWITPRMSVTLPNLIYIRPEVDGEKVRDINGSAKVEFPVNSITLLEDFRNNYAELSDIRGGIDSVRDNKDATLHSVSICGYASPEGSYANNERLARGRTQAVADYVKRIYSFPADFIKTSSVAEDWAGLRSWVEKSNLEHRTQIIEIIDDTALNPDARDQKIRKAYPEEYSTLLNMVYPGLRHTDYHISYSIRSYTDPAEILEVMKSHPGNLSLEELFAAAQSLDPDSDEFREVFEVAVRLHPFDPVANLNAANTALLRSDTKSARAYLEKAGDSKEAVYTRGLMALLEKDYDQAETLLVKAQEAGVAQTEEMLRQLRLIREYESK